MAFSTRDCTKPFIQDFTLNLVLYIGGVFNDTESVLIHNNIDSKAKVHVWGLQFSSQELDGLNWEYHIENKSQVGHIEVVEQTVNRVAAFSPQDVFPQFFAHLFRLRLGDIDGDNL